MIPRFTVTIPTYDRPLRLRRCLESFTKLDYPPGNWELIVVNDGGTSSFAQLTDELCESLPLRLVHQERKGPAAARNHGVGLGRGDLLAFTDDDCRVEPDWLRRFAQGFANGNSDALGGQTLNAHPGSAAANAWQSYLDFLCDYLRDDEGNALLLPSNNVAYRAGAFEAVGGFDVSFPLAAAEDYEIGHRVVAGGFSQQLFPGARLWHDHPMSGREYLRMQFRYGRGDHYMQRALKAYDHPRVSKPRRRRFYNELARHLLRRHAPGSTWAMLIATQFVFKAGRYSQALRSLVSRDRRRAPGPGPGPLPGTSG